MATPMCSLLVELSRDHFPHPPATPEELEAFEQRVGWKLDPDLRAFYLHCNGAALIRQVDGRYPLIDGDRETWPNPEYCTQIANSFSEFLEQVLRTRRSLYWISE